MRLTIYLLFLLVFTNFSSHDDPWKQVGEVLKNISPPQFKKKDYSILDYGAKGDGKSECTVAFRTAIAECSQQGGGRVIVPAGNYFTGPIHLLTNVNLHVEKNARILFSTNPKDYLPLVFTRWEGTEVMNYSPLIYAFGQENIAVTGEGILDGQADETNWWPWKGKEEYGWKPGVPSQEDKGKKTLLRVMAKQGIPVEDRRFGEGYHLRPQFLQPYKCKNVLIEGITIVNSPMWIINPVLCTNVIIQKVTVNSNGPNNDGCDPESCKNVLIRDCYFNTGDDCIALKSGRDWDGRRINVPIENVVIQHCKMANGHGGVVIGSEISGGARNIFAENCYMSSPELDRALRIKTSSNRGGIIENVYMRNVKVGQVKEQVLIATMFYEDSGQFMPTIRNVEMKNIEVENGGKCAFLLEGYAESPIENIRLVDCTVRQTETPYKFSNVKEVSFENVRINGKYIITP